MEETKRELIKETKKMGREAPVSGTGKGKQFGPGLASGSLLSVFFPLLPCWWWNFRLVDGSFQQVQMQVSSESSPFGICSHKYFLVVSLSLYDFYSSFIVITSSFGFLELKAVGF